MSIVDPIVPYVGVVTGVVLVRDDNVGPGLDGRSRLGQRPHLAEILLSAFSLMRPVNGSDRRTTASKWQFGGQPLRLRRRAV
jgi:hypothetical protein